MRNRNDDAIAGDIIALLGLSPAVHATAIRVHVDNGSVRLEGVVDTLLEKLEAEKLAGSVRGVKRVENDLVISADEEILDLELTELVCRRLVEADLEEVGVRVNAGTAFLMGVVPSASVRDEAFRIAESVSGIRGAVSELEIAAGEPVDDITLANDVVESLSEDPSVDIMDLEVSASDGRVSIRGIAGSRKQRELAVLIVERVPGVRDVANRLRLLR